MENLFTPLTDDELDQLDTFLMNRVDDDVYTEGMNEGVINISTLDGLFTAIVSGPVAIAPPTGCPWCGAILNRSGPLSRLSCSPSR